MSHGALFLFPAQARNSNDFVLLTSSHVHTFLYVGCLHDPDVSGCAAGIEMKETFVKKKQDSDSCACFRTVLVEAENKYMWAVSK